MDVKDLTSWLIQQYGQEQLKADPGLQRMREALSPILSELKKIPVVTIAGTNGKGETTLWLSRLFKNKSHCVWISPHIQRLNERFVSQEGEIKDQELISLIQSTHDDVQSHGPKLSYYEFLFLAFCRWAHQRKPELLLLEVGLGGRMDAVNVFDASLVLLPSISRDHQEFLGPRYELILKEKLGLLRPDTLLISYLSLQYLREKTGLICEQVGARWLDLESLKMHQSYDFSRRNQLLAYAAFMFFSGHSLKELRSRSFYDHWHPSSDSLEHRGEVICEGNEYHLFGSHNVDGMRKLIQFLHSDNYTFKRLPFDCVIAAFSKRDEADLRVLLKILKASTLGEIFITTFPHPKAMKPEVMEKLAIQEGLTFVPETESIIKNQNHQKGVRRILVTGSYYFLGHFKSLLGR